MQDGMYLSCTVYTVLNDALHYSCKLSGVTMHGVAYHAWCYLPCMVLLVMHGATCQGPNTAALCTLTAPVCLQVVLAEAERQLEFVRRDMDHVRRQHSSLRDKLKVCCAVLHVSMGCVVCAVLCAVLSSKYTGGAAGSDTFCIVSRLCIGMHGDD